MFSYSFLDIENGTDVRSKYGIHTMDDYRPWKYPNSVLLSSVHTSFTQLPLGHEVMLVHYIHNIMLLEYFLDNQQPNN